MITVEQAREKYPNEYSDLTDEQLQDVLDFFYKAGYNLIDHLIQQKNHESGSLAGKVHPSV